MSQKSKLVLPITQHTKLFYLVPSITVYVQVYLEFILSFEVLALILWHSPHDSMAHRSSENIYPPDVGNFAGNASLEQCAGINSIVGLVGFFLLYNSYK